MPIGPKTAQHLLSYIKTGKHILTFEDIDIEKRKRNYHHKTLLFLGDVDIEKR